MNRVCPECGRQLGQSGECVACGVAVKKKLGLFESLAITAAVIVVLGAVVFGISRFVGNPFKILSRLKLEKSGSYEVSRFPKDLTIPREPQATISIDQVAELREYFETEQFDSLNSILEEYQQAFETDIANEYTLHDAYEVFGVTLPEYEDLFTAWLAHSPDHYAPYLARAQYYYNNGWESRGFRWAKDTTEEQFREMRGYFKKAADDIEIALNTNQNLLPAHIILIGIFSTTSNDQRADDTFQNALALFPSSFLVRSQYMNFKRPRWGGSYREMENLAKAAEEYSDVNPHLPLLYGYIYQDQADNLKRAEKYEAAVELYAKAIAYGDSWYFYKERAKVYYYYLKDLDKALEDVEWSIFLRPTMADSYRLRSKIYYQKDDIANSLADLQASVLLKPGDSYTRKWQDWAANNSLHKGHRTGSVSLRFLFNAGLCPAGVKRMG